MYRQNRRATTSRPPASPHQRPTPQTAQSSCLRQSWPTRETPSRRRPHPPATPPAPAYPRSAHYFERLPRLPPGHQPRPHTALSPHNCDRACPRNLRQKPRVRRPTPTTTPAASRTADSVPPAIVPTPTTSATPARRFALPARQSAAEPGATVVPPKAGTTWVSAARKGPLPADLTARPPPAIPAAPAATGTATLPLPTQRPGNSVARNPPGSGAR